MNDVKMSPTSRLLRTLARLVAIAIPCGYFLLFFVVNANFREVVPQKVYRSGQPSEAQLAGWIRWYGIRTVINLRGKVPRSTSSLQAILNKSDVKLIAIRLSVGKVPTRNLLVEIIKTIETAGEPILIHCRQGVDRSGTVSALAAMAVGKEDYSTARWQAYVPPGPWKRKRKNDYRHISDILKVYENYCRRNKLSTDGWEQFRQWATDANSFSDKDVECCYIGLDGSRLVHQVAKLAREASIQFATELAILFLLAMMIHRRLQKKAKSA